MLRSPGHRARPTPPSLPFRILKAQTGCGCLRSQNPRFYDAEGCLQMPAPHINHNTVDGCDACRCLHLTKTTILLMPADACSCPHHTKTNMLSMPAGALLTLVYGHQRARAGELASRAGRSAWVACLCSSCSSCGVFLATAECFLQRIARDAKKCTPYRPRRSCRCAPKSFTKAAPFQGPPGGTVFRTTPPPRKVAVAIECEWLRATAWSSTQDALTNEEDG